MGVREGEEERQKQRKKVKWQAKAPQDIADFENEKFITKQPQLSGNTEQISQAFVCWSHAETWLLCTILKVYKN